jgi:hypothetical protein
VLGIVPVDESMLGEPLPDGFDAVSPEDAFGLADDPRGDGALGFETSQCDRGASLGGTVGALADRAVFSPVEPPSNLSYPDADVVFYRWETLVPDDRGAKRSRR